MHKLAAPGDDNDITVGDVAMTAGGLGAGAVGLKAHRDLSTLMPKVDAWDKRMQEAHDAHPIDRPLTWQEADQFIDSYSEGAKGVSQHRILGVPSARLAGGLRAGLFEGGLKALGGSVVQRSTEPMRRFSEHWNNPAYAGHYSMYADPATTRGDFHAHHLADVAMPANLGGDADFTKSTHDKFVFNDQVKEILHDPSMSAEAKYKLLNAQGHTQAAEQMRDAWLGNPAKGIRSASQHLMGSGTAPAEGKPPAPGYHPGAARQYIGLAGMGSKYVKPTALIGGLGGLALGAKGAYDIANKLYRRNAEEKVAAGEDEDTTAQDYTIGGIAGAGALASGIHGVNAYKDKPDGSVGITYGKHPVIGSGHAEPGGALRKILERAQTPGHRLYNPEAAHLRLDKEDIVRRDGVLKGDGGRRDVILDTGFGANIPNAALHDDRYGPGGTGSKTYMTTENAPTARRMVGYQTDASKRDGHMYVPQSATLAPLSERGNIMGDDYMTWGPGGREAANTVMFPHAVHDTGSTFSPAIDPDLIDEMHADSRNMDQVLDQVSGTLDLNTPEGADTHAKLQKLKGKKVITISGSGRGDFTGVRTNDLQAVLDKHPELAKEYGILTLHADGAKPYDHATGVGIEGEIRRRGAGQNVAALGRLDKKLFNALQGKAYAHWGGPGTSSASEIQHHPAIQIVPGHWGTNDRVSGTIGHMHREALANIGAPAHVGLSTANTDQWNPGNIQSLLEQPGTIRADNAEQLVKQLHDKPRMDWHKGNAEQRAFNAHAATHEGQKRVIQGVIDAQRGVVRSRRAHMAGGGLGALALGGLSAYEFMKDHNGDKVAFPISPIMDLAGLGMLATPSIAGLARRPMHKDIAHTLEIGGLGLVAAPAVQELVEGDKHEPAVAG